MRPFGAPLSTRWFQFYYVSLIVFVILTPFALLAQARGKERSVEHLTSYRTKQIDGLSIFYREAGPKDAPTILLLHGLPSSSRMFRTAVYAAGGDPVSPCGAGLSGVRTQRLAGPGRNSRTPSITLRRS